MALDPSDISIPFHTYMAQAEPYVRDLITWHPPSGVMNVLGLFGVICVIWLVAWRLNKPPLAMGEDAMVRHFRDQRVRYIVGELITDGVEEAVFKDKLTRAESLDIYQKFGRAFSLVDLLPKRAPRHKLSRGQTEHLKDQIRERIKTQTTANVEVLAPKRGSMLKRK